MTSTTVDLKVATKRWLPTFFVYEDGSESLSSSAGIARVLEMFTTDPELIPDLVRSLPDRAAYTSYPPLQMALMVMTGSWLGYDCLDDLEEMRTDPVLVAIFGEIPCAKTFGNFLRDFSPEKILELRELSTKQALAYRARLDLKSKQIEFSIDSTDHIHHGDLIEGLEFNYKGHWCLDSLEVFDECGFCFDFDLRPGATFSSQGSVEMMNKIMDKRPILPTQKTDAVHADSAFCREDFIRMCLLRRLKGTITAHGNIGWTEEVSRITNWQPWAFTTDEIERAALSGKSLPKIEVGYYMYSPAWTEGKISFPVVIKRTFVPYERIANKRRAQMILEKKDPKLGVFEHYAVLSLSGLHPRNPQQILEFHQARSNMENMIKEGKIAFDLRHFPCKKMNANHAYAILGMMAHNFFRFMALLDNKEHPQFAKALRARFVHVPGRIVRGQGKKYLRIPQPHFKEVDQLVTRWKETLKPSRSTA